ncbi:signal peptidase I [Peloplasma aerotolerans]|uniref:Signal peptidase I n=1 Tax=Peloplasma aerotolerans TaxID=3044389 RepID=A0AAW6UB63_9MOLU|nr:signal peptidase I [Mariniplasma sp. M4Ah]MDI6452904.1 signal peptidase I [Mariniplasma sp. M4Ah]
MEKVVSKKMVLNAIFYLMTALLSGFILIQIFAPEHTIKLLGFRSYVVITDSMEPLYNIGDILIVKPVDPEDLQVGDVITFKMDINNNGEKEIVTHYIYSIQKVDGVRMYESISHKSILSNNQPDQWGNFTDEDIIGLVTSKIAYVGYIIIFFKILIQNPILLGLIILNIAIIVTIATLLKKNKKE